jgi:putative two-component system hydrogenase maturation factor HypX/HoxX
MMAIAADHVVSHRGVVLNPSYKAMNLFGSEYWTYSLPKRVGDTIAQELTNSTDPISASYAHKIGMIDEILTNSPYDFVPRVIEYSEKKSQSPFLRRFLIEKEERLTNPQYLLKIESCREEELEK